MRGTLSIFFVAAMTAPAAAQVERGVTFQGVAAAGAGFTDNVASVPDTPAPGARGPESDTFADVQPQLVLAYGGNRTTQRLAYTFFASFYASHSSADSYSNTIDYQSMYETSARTRLTFDTSVSGGTFGSFQLAQQSSQTTITQLPPGSFGYVSARAGQGFQYEPVPEMRYFESAGFLMFLPIQANTQPSSYDVDLDLGAEKSWTRHALGLDVRSSILVLGALPMQMGAPPPTPMTEASRDQLMESATLRWRHDLDLRWSTELAAGVTTVFLASDLSKNATEPSGHATLRYTRDEVRGDVGYSHVAQPNAFVAQTFFVDEVSAHAEVPLPRQGLSFGAGTGYQYARIVTLAPGGQNGSGQAFVADASLGWAPIGSAWGLSVRYFHFQQTGSQDMGMNAVPSMTRNLVLVNISAAYPNQQAAARPLHSPFRVDRSDAIEPGQ